MVDITFDEYVEIIEDELKSQVKSNKEINLRNFDIYNKDSILQITREISLLISSFIIPALSPTHLDVSLKRKNNSLMFSIISEKLYGKSKINIGNIVFRFTKKGSSYICKSINVDLNSHYFLIFGNIDKIQ